MFTASILALVKLTLYQGLKVGGAAQQVYQEGLHQQCPTTALTKEGVYARIIVASIYNLRWRPGGIVRR